MGENEMLNCRFLAEKLANREKNLVTLQSENGTHG